MDKKIETWMMSPEGIKAIWTRFEDLNKQLAFLTNWLAQTSVDLENQSKQLTTVEPTPTAPITEAPWGVGTNICRSCGQRKEMLQDESTCQDCMTAAIRASSQSDPVDTKSGPVELHSVCAPVHRRMFYLNEAEDNRFRALFAWEWCPISAEPVLKPRAKTPAQGVEATSSTSQKQPLKESVENSVEESVKSRSKCKHPKEYQTVAPDGHHFCGVCSETLPKE